MMMEHDLEQMMKEKLLESLIEHMSGKMGSDLGEKFPSKAMEVSVAAPDKGHLAEGLDKAKDITQDDDEDEDRLMALMGEKDDDEDLEA